jgi:hypothetical protein
MLDPVAMFLFWKTPISVLGMLRLYGFKTIQHSVSKNPTGYCTYSRKVLAPNGLALVFSYSNNSNTVLYQNGKPRRGCSNLTYELLYHLFEGKCALENATTHEGKPIEMF